MLAGGQAIDGPVELDAALLERSDQFVQALTQKLMMYALGRELEYFDMPQVRAIVRDAADRDYRFSAIVAGIVHSDAFRMQAVLKSEAGRRAGIHRRGLGSDRRLGAMYLTKKHLSRRTVLKGAGVFARAAVARRDDPGGDGTRADSRGAEASNRILLYAARRDHVEHGLRAGDGPLDAERRRRTSFKLSPILAPLEAHKRYVTSFGNLENKAPNNSVHTLVPATWLAACGRTSRRPARRWRRRSTS